MDVTVDIILTVNGGDEVSRAVADSPAVLGFETGRAAARARTLTDCPAVSAFFRMVRSHD